MPIYCYLYIVVGSQERKGISGGQRRRVSVAIEMMKEADMFLLDGMIRDCRNILRKTIAFTNEKMQSEKKFNLIFNKN